MDLVRLAKLTSYSMDPNRCSKTEVALTSAPDQVGLMGQVALTAVEHHGEADLDTASATGGHDREFVSMSNLVGIDESVDEFVDVPTDVDMAGIDLDPVEIYQEISVPSSQNP